MVPAVTYTMDTAGGNSKNQQRESVSTKNSLNALRRAQMPPVRECHDHRKLWGQKVKFESQGKLCPSHSASLLLLPTPKNVMATLITMFTAKPPRSGVMDGEAK